MHDRLTGLIQGFASTLSPEAFALSPDGIRVAFTLDVKGHSQIFALPTGRTAYPRRVTATLDDCCSPAWSPDGTRLVYERETALWIVNADGTDPRLLTDHPAGNSEPRWAPDGSRILYYSRRRGWEHLWTISPDGGKPTQITMGEFDGDDLAWSPDSQDVVYCCVHDQDLTTRGIYVLSSGGGQATLVSPRGAWSGAPHFSPDGRYLAYLSDYDGWFHIYLYERTTGETRQLTRGDYEDGGPYFYSVDTHGGPYFSPDGRRLAFVRHREGNFDVWVIDLENGREECISREDGHYRLIGWLADSQHLAVTYDNIARPFDLRIIGLDGTVTELTDSHSPALCQEQVIRPEWVTLPARDGLTIHAGLLRPHGTGDAAAPAVVFLHGGPNFQFGDYYYPLPELLAQAGYVVLAPNFRGSTGYGREFRQANFNEWGNKDAFDAIDAALWLQSQPYVDGTRISVIGPSYGGYLTLAALTLAPELFCAGVDLYGDSEIAESYRHGDRYGRMDLRRHMGTPEENPEGYRRGSPFYFADRIQAPVLILHGRNDRLVVPLMSEKMIEALRIENKYYESHFYKGEEHGFSKAENKKDAWERVLEFLDKYCKGQP